MHQGTGAIVCSHSPFFKKTAVPKKTVNRLTCITYETLLDYLVTRLNKKILKAVIFYNFNHPRLFITCREDYPIQLIIKGIKIMLFNNNMNACIPILFQMLRIHIVVRDKVIND